MKNLLLLVLLAAGVWYLLSTKDAPPPAPTVQQAAPTPADYSGVHTFYSTLNDPPVPAAGHTYSGSAVNLGNGSTGQPPK